MTGIDFSRTCGRPHGPAIVSKKENNMGRRQALLSVFCTILLLAGARVEAAESYYKGKRITLLINFAAGGPTDIEGRLFAKYLVKHIEAATSIIVRNMDGASGVVGA